MIEKSLKYANWLTEYGFSLIPLNSNPNDKHFRKRPRDKGWRTDKYTPADLQAAFRSTHAIGARVPAHYVVIDVDVKDGKQGLASLAKFPQDNLFSGSYVTTGSGGFHIFFRLPEDLEKIDTGVRSLPDIDFRTVGSQVVAAGSINAAGNPYTWDETTLDTGVVDIPEMPADIWAFLKPLQREIHSDQSQSGDTGSSYSDEELKGLLDSIDVTKYRDHDEWFKVMCAAHEASGGLGLEVFYEWCQKDPDPSKRVSHAELTKRWKSFDSSAGAKGGITRRYLESISAPAAKAAADFGLRAQREGIPPIQFKPSKVANPKGAAKIQLGPNLNRYDVATVDTQSVTEPSDDASVDDSAYIIDTDSLLNGPLEDLNDKYAVVNFGGQVRVASSSANMFGQAVHQFSKVSDFLVWTRNLPKLEVQKGNTVVMVDTAAQWLEWAGRKQYDRVDFYPGYSQDHVERFSPGTLNLWSGWRVEPLPPGDFDVVEGPGAIPPEECAHFTKLICYLSGHGEAWKDIEASFGSSYAGDGITLHRDTRYFLDWLAYSFAQPDTPIGVAVAMRGRKGIGKGVLSQFLSWMCGEYAMSTANMEHVTGKFNAGIQRAVFLFLDEALWSGSKTAARQLQNLLTEPVIRTEEKGMPASTTRNCLHVLLASNDDWIVPASGDDERRYCVFDSDPGLKVDYEYWRDIEKMYSLNIAHIWKGNLEKKKERLSKLLGWLIARGQWLEASGWRANQNIPQTEALKEQKEFSKDAFELWWEQDVLVFGELGGIDIQAEVQNHRAKKDKADGTVDDMVYIWVQKIKDQFLASEPGQQQEKMKVYSARSLTIQLGKFLSKALPGSKKTKGFVTKEERMEIEHSQARFQAYRLEIPVKTLASLARKLKN